MMVSVGRIPESIRDEAHKEWLARLPLTVECAWCSWREPHEHAAMALASQKHHMRQQHPERLAKKTRRGYAQSTDKELAELDADKRATLHGVERAR